MLEIILFSSICGVFGFAFLALPLDEISSRESVVITCENKLDWGPLTVYDAGTDIYKVYHKTEGCHGNLLLNGKVSKSFVTGHWKEFSKFGFYRCSDQDTLCDIFNPETLPNKNSLHIFYGEHGSVKEDVLSCSFFQYFMPNPTSHSKNLISHVNLPLFGNEGVCRWYDRDDFSTSPLIDLKSLSNNKVNSFKYGYDGEILVLLPKIRSGGKTDDVYIFTVVMNINHRLPYMVAMCLKKAPSKECDRHRSKVIAKEAINGISFSFEEELFYNDAYIEISGWKMGLSSSRVNAAREIRITHRVNKGVLEESQGEVFSKVNEYGTVYFHFFKFDASDISRDEEIGKLSVSLKIYGISQLIDLKKLYIQRDQEKRVNICHTKDSNCIVWFTTGIYKEMILQYDFFDKMCLWKHVAVTESQTKVCKDITMSITVVDYEGT